MRRFEEQQPRVQRRATNAGKRGHNRAQDGMAREIKPNETEGRHRIQYCR